MISICAEDLLSSSTSTPIPVKGDTEPAVKLSVSAYAFLSTASNAVRDQFEYDLKVLSRRLRSLSKPSTTPKIPLLQRRYLKNDEPTAFDWEAHPEWIVHPQNLSRNVTVGTVKNLIASQYSFPACNVLNQWTVKVGPLMCDGPQRFSDAEWNTINKAYDHFRKEIAISRMIVFLELERVGDIYRWTPWTLPEWQYQLRQNSAGFRVHLGELSTFNIGINAGDIDQRSFE